jgi:hypothetical protein
MAYTLFNKSHSRAPVSSPTVQLPAVFIFPPEEEQHSNPPWCFLDANDGQGPRNLTTVPDLEFLDIALNVLQHQAGQDDSPPPAFHRSQGSEQGSNVVMPKRGAQRSPVDKKESPDRARTENPEGVDADKVPEVTGSPGEVKSPRTLRARASRAFKSIKNVGKGPPKAKTPVQDVWSAEGKIPAVDSSQSQTILTRVDLPPLPVEKDDCSPNLSRQSSCTLPELPQASLEQSPPFDVPSTLPTRSRCSSGPQPSSPRPSTPPSPSPLLTSSPYFFGADTPLSLDLRSDFRPEDNYSLTFPRTSVKSATPRSRKTSRFSLLNLHGLFTSSAPSNPQPTPTNTPVIPASLVMSSRDSSAPSTSTEASSLETPLTSPVDFGEPFSVFGRGGSVGESTKSAGDQARGLGPELRLMSLQFDSISFDANHF